MLDDVRAGTFDSNQPVSVVQYGNSRPLPCRFETKVVENKAATKAENRFIGREVDYIKIYLPGQGEPSEFRWDSMTAREQAQFMPSYKAWKERRVESPVGTPIERLLWLSPSRIDELKRRFICTVEQYVELSEPDIQRLGMGTRGEVEKAKAFLAQAKDGGTATRLAQENTELKEQLAALTEDMKELRRSLMQSVAPRTRKRKEKKEISDDQQDG